ncbi:transporter [Brevibacterium linens]|uniref:Transporter n=1 Tax=Brevibacterium linens TaxID=1703 RepID=A0A142NL28_BRELN|nr:MFS transporter [Brevibacterium linens]AMT93049.1 transporter [Brevibacterium linens]
MTTGRGFGVLWSANALSNLADGLAFISMPLLAASMTDDPRIVAGLATLYAIVRLFVALPIGVLVDRIDRRLLIINANLLRGLALLAFALTLHLGLSSLVILYLSMAVVATLESTADNAAVAILPSLVDRGRLDSANGRIAATQLVADEFAGPPLGGFLIAIAAAAPVFAMGGLWAAAGLVALALPVHPRRHNQLGVAATLHGPRSVYKEALEGIAWLAHHRLVGGLALIGALASVGYMLTFSILVLFAWEKLGLNETSYGLLLACSALGGLLGSLITSKLRNKLGYRWTIAGSLLLGALSMGGLAMSTNPIIAGALLAAYILHAVVWNICSTSLRQRLVPDAMLGRVGGATRVLGLLGLALGSFLGGFLGTTSLVTPVATAAGVFVVCSILAALIVQDESTISD